MKLKRGHFNNQGKFVSFKMKRTVLWKSLLEFDYIHLLELDHQVKSYDNCDFKLTCTFSESEFTIHPNFIIQREENSFLAYILNSTQKTENNTQRLKTLQKLCSQKGHNLEIIAEEDIRCQPRLTNSKVILKYATKKIESPLPRLLCYRLFHEKESFTLNCCGRNDYISSKIISVAHKA